MNRIYPITNPEITMLMGYYLDRLDRHRGFYVGYHVTAIRKSETGAGTTNAESNAGMRSSMEKALE